MQLFIPEIGTKLILLDTWEFELIGESRNKKLGDCIGVSYVWGEKGGIWKDWIISNKVKEEILQSLGPEPSFKEARTLQLEKSVDTYLVKFPPGVELTVDRIYIRKGKQDYSSVSFWAKGLDKKKIRFFAKLDDVNKISFI